ncbi:MAG: DUF4388 domain-containing protein [Chitinivibrionales bacterium]|nr:DUF4388 domain-containing protein [Chitinivibrionales bacterium]
MALSGSLKEFDLADIFQLIGQQKKTGRLVLVDGKRQGYAVFKDGFIVAAGSDDENLISLLVNYLVSIKQQPYTKISEFLTFCKGSIRHFAEILVKIQYLKEDELLAIAETGIEDLACALFAWTKGEYRFDAQQNVDSFQIWSVSFSPDAITMEAMRRIDEWQRMGEHITDDAVFVAADPQMAAALPAESSDFGINDAPQYILSLLDGKVCVQELCTDTFLSTYRINEILNDFLANGTIVRAGEEYLANIRPVERSGPRKDDNERIRLSALSTLATIIAAAVMVVLGSLVLPRLAFFGANISLNYRNAALDISQARENMAIGRIGYEIMNGEQATDIQALRNSDLLSEKSIKALVAARKLNKAIDAMK